MSPSSSAFIVVVLAGSLLAAAGYGRSRGPAGFGCYPTTGVDDAICLPL